MSTLLEVAVQTVKQFKENIAPEKDHDIRPSVFFGRGGILVAGVCARDVDRDQGLTIVRIGVPGFDADEVVLALDAHMSRQLINPATGKEWGPHEMQNACDAEGACDVGLLQDCLIVAHYSRRRAASPEGFLMLPYDHDNGHVAWLNPQEKPGMVSGLVHEVIVESFTTASARVGMIQTGQLPIGLAAVQQPRIDRKIASIMSLMLEADVVLPREEFAREVADE